MESPITLERVHFWLMQPEPVSRFRAGDHKLGFTDFPIFRMHDHCTIYTRIHNTLDGRWVEHKCREKGSQQILRRIFNKWLRLFEKKLSERNEMGLRLVIFELFWVEANNIDEDAPAISIVNHFFFLAFFLCLFRCSLSFFSFTDLDSLVAGDGFWTSALWWGERSGYLLEELVCVHLINY